MKQAVKRAPFVIFSKTAPSTLPDYDVDRDFQYYFFADSMHVLSGVPPSFLAGGGRNAKTDFPADFEAYFKDDVEVTTGYPHPAFRTIVEPWAPPGTHSIVHTRKTGVDFAGRRYMLGCFSLFDDVELGVTRFRERRLAPSLPDLPHVTTEWYAQAFHHLPQPMALVDDRGGILAANAFASGVGVGSLEAAELHGCVARAREASAEGRPGESWEFSRVKLGSRLHRVWVWRPVPDSEVLAVAAREHLSSTAAGLPDLVVDALG